MKKLCYNSGMKIFTKIIVLFCFFLGNCVSAVEPFKLLVLPVDLFYVCENYYCFPEASEVFAEDIIYSLNKSGKIISPDLYTVRKKLTGNSQLKTLTENVLYKFNTSNSIDFISLKKISQAFDTKSVLLISSSVVQNSDRRNIWEVMEVSSAFEALNQYLLETNVVLTDNINDVVMWSGKYKKTLGDNESRFWAVTSAQAAAQLEKIKWYSRDIISKTVSQNIILRFYPKVTKPVVPSVSTKETQKTDFRPNPLGTNMKLQDDKDYGEIHSETIFDF